MTKTFKADETNSPLHPDGTKDKRYMVQLIWCGYTVPKYRAYWCNEVIEGSQYRDTSDEAWQDCRDHRAMRDKMMDPLISKPCQIHLVGITKPGKVISKDTSSYLLRTDDGAQQINVGIKIVERKFAANDPYFYAC